MERRNITLSLSRRSTDVQPDIWVNIDQFDFTEPQQQITFNEWADANNIPRTVSGIDAVLDIFDRFESYCSEDGSVDVPLYVRCYPFSLHDEYRAVASYGELFQGTRIIADIDKSYDISLTDTLTLDFLPQGELTITWDGDCYDVDGRVIPPPSISIDEYILTFSEEVVGTIRIVGSEIYVEYILRIYPRDGDFEDRKDAYQSTFRIFYRDSDDEPKFEEHSVEPPEIRGRCTGGSRFVVVNDDDNCVKRILTVNSCDPSEILAERFEPMPCPDTET